MRTRSLVWPVSLLVAAALTGCNTLNEEEQEIGEAASYLMMEDDEDAGADGAAFAEEAALDNLAEETASSEPADASNWSPCDFEAYKTRVVAHYDDDGDGALSRQERRELRGDIRQFRTNHPRWARLMRRVRVHAFARLRLVFDENEDGVLDAEERTVMVDTMEARCEARRQRVLDRFDADGDGSLNRNEIQAARAARRAWLKAKWQEVLANYDENGDGFLGLKERLKIRADIRWRLLEKAHALVEEFDADGDGHLNAEERAAARQAIRDRIAQMGDMEAETGES